MGLTRLIKLFNIFLFLYHFTFIGVSFYFLVHCTYFRFS